MPEKARRSTQKPFDPEFDGQYLWKVRCAGCHGLDGTGNKKAGGANAARDVTNAVWQADHSDEEIRASIKHGLPGTKMHAFGELGSEAQFDALVAWIRSLRRR